jgi:hypothetical protein
LTSFPIVTAAAGQRWQLSEFLAPKTESRGEIREDRHAVAVGEIDNLFVRIVADSEHAGGRMFSFRDCDQNCDRIGGRVIGVITPASQSGNDAVLRVRDTHEKRACLGAVRGLVALAKRERERASVVFADYIEGHRLGRQSASG